MEQMPERESKTRYENPLTARYASREMQAIFSPDRKFTLWRQLWVALAEAEQALGLKITDDQINEMKAHLHDIDYDAVAREERLIRHDVMSHVHVFGDCCPTAKPIIHLGATSCYVGDNTDLILMRDALQLIRVRLLQCIQALADFADRYKDLPTLGFTHFQPAQPVTVGKRAALWLQDLVMDLEDLDYVASTLRFLGSKGTTGTQASFMDLFDGDESRVRRLDQLIAEKMGFDRVYDLSGQTYSRKVDARVCQVLAGIAQSAHKFSNDIRLLQHLKEVEEPFETGQIGSSAMAYKRNPMRSERMASLSRLVLSLTQNPAHTAATQWFERTLDDSAGKRVSVPEAFLAVDSILSIYLNVCSGLVVYPKMIERHLQSELPFMATENILMAEVKRGGDRQQLHERIRVHAMAAGRRVKTEGLDNDLLERIAADPAFHLDLEALEALLDAALYTGRCAGQVTDYLNRVVNPLLSAEQAALAAARTDDLTV